MLGANHAYTATAQKMLDVCNKALNEVSVSSELFMHQQHQATGNWSTGTEVRLLFHPYFAHSFVVFLFCLNSEVGVSVTTFCFEVFIPLL